MSINYAGAAQWGLVPALGVLLSITITLSYHLFYNKLLEKENSINSKVRSDLTKKVKLFNQITTKNTQGEEEFAEHIENVVEFKEILKESKDLFRENILISALFVVLLGIIFIVWDQRRDIVLFVGSVILIAHFYAWNQLRQNYNKLENYLNGGDPKKILDE